MRRRGGGAVLSIIRGGGRARRVTCGGAGLSHCPCGRGTSFSLESGFQLPPPLGRDLRGRPFPCTALLLDFCLVKTQKKKGGGGGDFGMGGGSYARKEAGATPEPAGGEMWGVSWGGGRVCWEQTRARFSGMVAEKQVGLCNVGRVPAAPAELRTTLW